MAWLPKRLPTRDAIVWSKRMTSPALAGVAATKDAVIVADRDPADRVDVFRCYNADGSDRWTIRYPAPGSLDYGNSARATPLIHGETVYLSGAHGHFQAVELATGAAIWKKNFRKDFGDPGKLDWGYCGSPLIAEGRLIVQPGGPQAAVVALDPATGEVQWKTPGRPPGHSSFVFAEYGGRKQIVGYDNESLGGWDLATGERLWALKPELGGDFNVPTPIVWGEGKASRLVVATENNGVRIYGFNEAGRIVPEPQATSDRLLPDSHTPVLVNDGPGQGRLLGVSGGLFCLDAARGLAELWRSDDGAFREYASVVASPDRILVTTLKGRLILAAVSGRKEGTGGKGTGNEGTEAVAAEAFEKLSDLQLFEDEAGLYSHPALVGRRIYVRGSNKLICLDLDDSTGE